SPPPSEFTNDTEAVHDMTKIVGHFQRKVGGEQLYTLDAHDLALQHFGDAILSNMIMLGYAWQLGAVPVSVAVLQQAITLNGVAVEENLRAFQLGRLAAWRPDALRSAAPATTPYDPDEEALDEIFGRHQEDLTAY